MLLASAIPGLFGCAVVTLLVVFEYLQWPSRFESFTNAFVWAATLTPMVVVLGTVTLTGGVLIAPFLPGRPKRKWGILLVGTIAWGVAFYALHVPGLVDLP